MAKKQNLRKQVKALEALAGLETLSADDAKTTNGGFYVVKKIKNRKGTGALVARGTGALWAGFGSGAIMAKGSGALRAMPGSGS